MLPEFDPAPWNPAHQARRGCVEVITGSMFSGKTEELIRRLRQCVLAKRRVQTFKPRIDDRYDSDRVVSHFGLEIEAVAVPNSATLGQACACALKKTFARAIVGPQPHSCQPIRAARDTQTRFHSQES